MMDPVRPVSKTAITEAQARDTGMALVLLCLVAWYARGLNALVIAAMVLHVVNMTSPRLYRPAAVVWFTLSHALGSVASRVLLAIIFFGVVTPIGVIRRMLGADSMQLKAFKAGRGSVMDRRDHTYTGRDIELPY